MADSTLGPGLGEDRVAVVVNGNARRVTEDLVEVLDQIVKSGDLFVSRSLEEGHDIARQIVARGYPTVLTGGGDGTFVQMVTWVTEEAERTGKQPPRFGLLRLGTGNALAWVLGAQNARGRGVVPDLLRLRREAGSRPLRLLTVEGRMTPFAGVGGDAAALLDFHETKEVLARVPRVGHLATGSIAHAIAILGRTAPHYLMRPAEHVRVVNAGSEALRIGVEGQPVGSPLPKGEVLWSGHPRMVIMSTIPYWGFGARIFPFATDREDRFQLRVVDISPVTATLHIRSIWRGTFRHDGVHDFLADRVVIEASPAIPLQIGGDPVGRRTQVEVSLAERPIQVVDYYAPPTTSDESVR